MYKTAISGCETAVDRAERTSLFPPGDSRPSGSQGPSARFPGLLQRCSILLQTHSSRLLSYFLKPAKAKEIKVTQQATQRGRALKTLTECRGWQEAPRARLRRGWGSGLL